MVSTAKLILYRFGQVSTLAVVAGMAMAAAPEALTVAQAEPEPVVAQAVTPPVVAEPVAFVRTIKFERPVANHPINSNFGVRHLQGEEHARMHQGVDIAAPQGSRVMASAEGVVTASGYDSGYGNYVEIRHENGVRTFYGHLSRIERGVVAGSTIEGGQLIGRVGSTGYSTGPHLHFEVRRRGERVNPANYLGREFVLESGAA